MFCSHKRPFSEQITFTANKRGNQFNLLKGFHLEETPKLSYCIRLMLEIEFLFDSISEEADLK